MGSHFLAFSAAFLGSAVESVEALTIVLAVGLSRGWRDALAGTVAALVVLAALVAAFGGLITSRVPEPALKATIGTLVLLFGMRWLQKAVLRSSGVIAMHDEEAAFQETMGELRKAGRTDWAAFVLTFKGVFLEGLEVVFIVFAVGASAREMPSAAAGALVATVVIAVIGAYIRHPLARVPENLIKHTVGILLTSLGTFWLMEGLGVKWPIDIGSVVLLVVLFVAITQVAIGVGRSLRPAPERGY